MRNWLIYEPPGGARPTLEDAEKFVTVREGFSKLAFIVPFIWLIWRRCWLALVLYVVAEVAVALIGRAAGVSGGAMLVLAFLPNLAVGLEAAWVRARALERRGFTLAGSVMARSSEEAEAMFFHEWLSEAPAAARSAPAGAAPYRPAGPGVLGFFPEPGAAR
ncbi:MAG: DUF2628 domain-containing protein [Hansschlegelia sp.]